MLHRTTSIGTLPHTIAERVAQYTALSLLIAAATLGIAWKLAPDRATAIEPAQSSIESQLIDATNTERAQAGLAPLTWNPALYAAATAKAADMLHDQYFDHIAPDGATPWVFITSRYSYDSAGENLAVDFRDPMHAIPAWMQSPSHRANILDTQFREVGIVVMSGTLHGKQTTVIVQMFGEPTTNALLR